MMMRILAFGLLTIGTLVAVAPSASAYTYCYNHLYNPLDGNPMVTTCTDYSYSGNCSYYSNYVDAPVYLQYSGGYSCSYYNYSTGCWDTYHYYDYPVFLYYESSHWCGGETTYCYLGLAYWDPSNIRTGLC